MNWHSVIAVGLISEMSRASLLLIGLATMLGGIMLMFRHKRDIEFILETEKDSRIRLFEQRKFRRRSLASTLVAAIGVLMSALYWAFEPAVFVGLISVVLILLVAVMFIAFLDLMSVSLHTVAQDDSARQKMVDEYVRQRRKLLDRVEDQESQSNS